MKYEMTQKELFKKVLKAKKISMKNRDVRKTVYFENLYSKMLTSLRFEHKSGFPKEIIFGLSAHIEDIFFGNSAISTDRCHPVFYTVDMGRCFHKKWWKQ